MQKNLKNKYGITEEQLKAGIDCLAKNVKKIPDISVMFAICDLLNNGDIQAEESSADNNDMPKGG